MVEESTPLSCAPGHTYIAFLLSEPGVHDGKKRVLPYHVLLATHTMHPIIRTRSA